MVCFDRRAGMLSAVLVLGVVLGVVPGGSGVMVSAAVAQTPSLPEHYSVNSRHYEIITDLPRDEIREHAAHMDAMYAAYSRMFSSFERKSQTPVRLYLWSTRDHYLQHGASMGGDWTPSGGVFFRRAAEGGVSTWIRDQSRPWLRQLLQHEGFHQFAHYHLGPTLPLWANEGLAVYFEKALLVRGKLVQGMTPGRRVDLMKQAIENDRHFPIQELMAITSEEWWAVMQRGDGRASIMYTQAWALVHFLIHADNGRFKRAFEQYLREIANGMDHAQAFAAAFGTGDTAAFERRWMAYVQALEPDPLGEATERLEFMAGGILALRKAGVNVTGIAELKHELQRRNYAITRVIDGVRHEIEATDEMFEAPGSGNSRRRGPTLEALPGEQRRDGFQFPPRLVVRGLEVAVGLDWKLDEAGELVYEVVYR